MGYIHTLNQITWINWIKYQVYGKIKVFIPCLVVLISFGTFSFKALNLNKQVTK